MTEMPKISDIEKRFLCLLRNCRSETELTEAYSHCASLVLWRFQTAIEGKPDAQVKIALKTPRDALGICIYPNSHWTGKKPGSQINPDCAYQVLKALRNCFAHLDGNRVEPKNDDGKLMGFTFFLAREPNNKDDCRYRVELDFDGLKRLGEKISELG